MSSTQQTVFFSRSEARDSWKLRNMAQDNERDGFFAKDNLAPGHIQSAVALTSEL